MSAIYLLIPISLIVAVGFLVAFIWAVKSGQYEDTETPSMRVLADDVQPSASSATETDLNRDKNDER